MSRWQATIQCHFLPDLDDGLAEVEQSLRFLRGLYNLGWQSVVATSYIMQDYYLPDPALIVQKTQQLERLLRQEHIPVKLEPAAEYYWDEGLSNLLESDQELMCFTGNERARKFVLVETSLVHRPENFGVVMNILKQKGYSPVLSHAEQYVFLQQMPERVSILREAGVCFQVNLRSLTYEASPEARRLAQWLIREDMVDFWSAPPRLDLIQQAMESPLFPQIR